MSFQSSLKLLKRFRGDWDAQASLVMLCRHGEGVWSCPTGSALIWVASATAIQSMYNYSKPYVLGVEVGHGCFLSPILCVFHGQNPQTHLRSVECPVWWRQHKLWLPLCTAFVFSQMWIGWDEDQCLTSWGYSTLPERRWIALYRLGASWCPKRRNSNCCPTVC